MANHAMPRNSVTVVLPMYNAAKTLPGSLSRLSAQTHKQWELVAFDDGSQDDSTAVLMRWADSVPQEVRVLNGTNGGPSRARNLAAAEARAELIAFLDADDLWHPNKLRLQVALMAHQPWLIAVGCGYRIVQSDHSVQSRTIRFDWSPLMLLKWSLLEGYGPALCSTLVVRKAAFNAVEGFDPDLRNLEDLDMAQKLMRIGRVGYVDAPLVDYVMGNDQNHRDTDSVRHAVEVLSNRTPFSYNRALRRRLLANLRLLEAKRAWSGGQRVSAVQRATVAFAQSPIHSGRTVLNRLTES